MSDNLKEYKGIVWPRMDDSVPGRRFVVWAANSREAMQMAKEQFGADTIITLKNEGDANKPR